MNHQEAQVAEFRDSLSRAYQRFNALERAEKCCFGVTLSQCMTLELLLRDGPAPVRTVADTLGLDTSTVTRVVDVLVRDGLVRRERDEKGDRRRVYVSLSARGRTLAEKLQRSADAYCARILEQLPSERHAQIIDALRVLVGALDLDLVGEPAT